MVGCLPLPDSGGIPVGPTILNPVFLLSVGLRNERVSHLRPRRGGVGSEGQEASRKGFFILKKKPKNEEAFLPLPLDIFVIGNDA